ncbi:MAG: hypothetical protein KAR20_12655, partial [Candidatus Heimdallarchaeota archaeon]|nr:hypothetical protein [Candidatus Heimdallarchaeota archaeon]
DIKWLKCALLYWDAIRCITPDVNYFDSEIKYLSDEGLIVATDPKDYSTDASVLFARKMQKYCHNQGELDTKVRNYLEEKFPQLENVAIHSGKFCEKVFRAMGHKVFLGNFENGVNKLYYTQPYISALYLMLLAAEASKKIKAPMLTDVPGLSGLGENILWSDEILPVDTGQDNILMQLNIDFPSKEDLENISFDDIIRFRQKRNDERRKFRSVIEDIRCTAQGLEDANALLDYLSDKRQDIQQAIDDQKKLLCDIGIKGFASSIKATWPSVFGIPIGNIAGGAAGISSAIGLASLSLACSKIAISQEYQSAIRDCPWHYLINLEQEVR